MILDNLVKKIKENISGSTMFLFILSCIVYSPFMVQQLNNADDNTFGYLYHADYYWTENNLGRFFIQFFDVWRNRIVSPVLIVVLSLVFLSAMAELIARIFDIKSGVTRVLVGALVIFAPSMADMFTYYYTADSYAFAYFLVVLSVYLLLKTEWKFRWAAAIVCMVISMGIYQAYTGFAFFLISVWFITKGIFEKRADALGGCLLKGETSSGESRGFSLKNLDSFQKKLWGGYFSVAGAMGAYYILFKILTAVGYVVPLGDRGMGGMLETMLKMLPVKILEMYRVILEYFFTDVIVSNSWFARKYVNIIVVIMIFIAVAILIIKGRMEKKLSGILMLIFTLFVTVSSLSMIVVLGPDTSVYAETGILMLPYMNGLYILMLLLGELLMPEACEAVENAQTKDEELKGEKVAASDIAVLLTQGISIILVIIMIVFIQVFARYIDQQQKQITSLATRVSSRIEALEDYSEGMKVLAVGRPHKGNYSLPDEQYESITKGMISHYSMIFGADDQISAGWIKAFKYYVGIEYSEVSADERNMLLDSEEVKNMGAFPADDSVKKVNDIVIVKFSE